MDARFSGTEGILSGTEALLSDPKLNLVVVDGLEEAAELIRTGVKQGERIEMDSPKLRELLAVEEWEALFGSYLDEKDLKLDSEMYCYYLGKRIMPHVDFNIDNLAFIGPITGSLAWDGQPGRFYCRRLPENGLDVYNDPDFYDRYHIDKTTGHLAVKQACEFMYDAENVEQPPGTMVLFPNFPAVGVHAVHAPRHLRREVIVIATDIVMSDVTAKEDLVAV